MVPPLKKKDVELHQQGGCWPTPSQRLLLRACLKNGPAALEAWKNWLQLSSLDHMDPASMRLIPLLYTQLLAGDPTAPEHGRAKGIYRFFWARHQQTLRSGLPAVEALTRQGIPVMLCKGAALNLTVYPTHAIRPMEDIDVLVPFRRAAEAIGVFLESGWRPHFQDPRPLVHVGHACHFYGPRGAQVDLHWHLLRSDCRPEADDVFWERSQSAQWHQLEVRIPSDEDQLLHACEHGACYNVVAPLRWLADAALLLRKAPRALDWDYLAAAAQKRDITLPLLETLEYLRTEIGLDISEPALRCLRSQSPSLLARLHQAALRLPAPRGPTFWNQLPAYLLGYLRLKRSVSYDGLLRDVAPYLESIHNLDRPLRAYVSNQIRLAGAGALARLRGWRHLSTKVLWHADMARNGITWDVYAKELHIRRLFCWTKPKAVFHFPATGPARYLELVMPDLPYLWKELTLRGFEALVDGRALEMQPLGRNPLVVRMNLPDSSKGVTAPWTLELRVGQSLQPEQDRRTLGLPICAIRAVR